MNASVNKLRTMKEPAVHATVWLVVYFVSVFFIKTIGPFKKVDGTLLMPVTFGTIVNILLFYTVSLLLIPRLFRKQKVADFIVILILVLGFYTISETLIDSSFFRTYYSDMKESFFSQFILNLVLNIFVLSLSFGYGFTKNWIRNEKMKQQLHQEKLSAELNFLRSQLNPHFLFNVLNMAYSSASKSGDEKTADIIERLSGLMRYMLYESNVERIELEKEAEYLRNYIDLQKMRFSEDLRVKVTFKTEGSLSGVRIAPMILIQFVENAFKYGVKLEKESEIGVRISVQDQNLIFEVRNPVFNNNSDTPHKASGIGIENVKKRLEILYNGNYDLRIEPSPEQFYVRLLINLTQ